MRAFYDALLSKNSEDTLREHLADCGDGSASTPTQHGQQRTFCGSGLASPPYDASTLLTAHALYHGNAQQAAPRVFFSLRLMSGTMVMVYPVSFKGRAFLPCVYDYGTLPARRP